MKRIYAYFLVLTLGVMACSDRSRDDYSIPDRSKIDSNKQLEVVLEQLSESIKSNPSDPLNYYKRASWQYNAGNLEEALVDISRAEVLNPNSGEISFLKSQILYKTDKDNALTDALFAERQGLVSPDLYTMIGNLYLDKNNFSKSREYFNQAEELYPYNAALFNGKARFSAKRGDTLTAFLNYKRALSLRQDVFEYYDDLIKIYGESRHLDSALKLNEIAIRKFPDKTELVYNKALALERAGLADSSIQIYRRFLKLEPKRTEVYGKIGDLYLRHKNYSGAFRAYDKWAKEDIDNVKPTVLAAKTLIAQQNYNGAKNYINGVLEKHPDNKELNDELAIAEYLINRNAESYQNSIRQNNSSFKSEDELQTKRIFNKSFELNKLPKRSSTLLGVDSLRKQ